MRKLYPLLIFLLGAFASLPGWTKTDNSLLEDLLIGPAAHAASQCAAGYQEFLVLDGVVYCSSTPPDSKTGKYGCGKRGAKRCSADQENPCSKGYRACKPPGADMPKAFCCAAP